MSAKLVPEFSMQRNLKASEQFPEDTRLSEDDSVILHLKASCDVEKAAHASVAFSSSPTQSKVVMMKSGSDSQSLKGKVKVADLKPLVRSAWCCMTSLGTPWGQKAHIRHASPMSHSVVLARSQAIAVHVFVCQWLCCILQSIRSEVVPGNTL